MARSPRDNDALNVGLKGVNANTVTIDIEDAGRVIKLARADLRLAARQTVAEARKVGALLLAAQKLIPDDHWLDWCRIEAGVSQKAGRRFMKLATSDIDDGSIASDGLAYALTSIVERGGSADD